MGDDVEEERVDVVVKRLVIQEHLRQETEVLTIHLILPSIDLKDLNPDSMVVIAISVDLITRRIKVFALHPMTSDLEFGFEILQTLFTDP